MKTLLSLSLLLTFMGIKAQNNLVVFSENGEKFFLIINGVKQNIEAETNVKVTELIQPTYKAKIVFEDKAKGIVDQNIYFMQGGEPVKNYEFVYSVGIKKKGLYKARPVSAVAIGGQAKNNPDQAVVHYATSEPTPDNNNVINVADDSPAAGNSNVQTEQTITQTQTSYDNSGSVNMGIRMDANGVNIKAGDGMGNGNDASTTISQTVTTTKTSGETTNNKSTTATSSNAGIGTSPKSNNTAVACGPMSATEFKSAKESIGSKSFDDSKLKIAKQVLGNNCMSSDQVKEVMGLFSFEQSKLDFAKYAYGHTADQKNYYKINDAFTFESSITELDNHIKKTSNNK
jgi:hypothetical protein